MVAGVAQLREQQRLRRLAAAGRDRADPALEARDPLLERRDGRVAEPRVDVPVLLQREQVGGVLGVLEHERRRLVDRDGARAGGRVGARAGVDRARAHAPVAVLDRVIAGEGSKVSRAAEALGPHQGGVVAEREEQGGGGLDERGRAADEHVRAGARARARLGEQVAVDAPRRAIPARRLRA